MDPQSSLFVCGLPRAGTSTFCERLERSGVVGKPATEWFNPAAEATLSWQAGGFASWKDYLAYALQEGTTSNGVFGVKQHGDHLAYLFWQLRRAYPEHERLSDYALLRQIFPQLDSERSFIYVWRAGLLEQTVSYAIAETSGSWRSGQPTTSDPQFNLSLLDRAYWQAINLHKAWLTWFERYSITPYVVQYETLVADSAVILAEVFEHIGIDCPPGVSLTPTRNQRQATDLNGQWQERFEESLAERFPFGYMTELTIAGATD